MFRMFWICSNFSDNAENVQNLFRKSIICSECSVNVQNVQNMFRIFSQCSECSKSVQTQFRMFRFFRQCSDSVQTFSEFSESSQNFQSMFRMFRIFSQCSESVQTCSEFLAQKLVYSEFLHFVVNLDNDYIVYSSMKGVNISIFTDRNVNNEFIPGFSKINKALWTTVGHVQVTFSLLLERISTKCVFTWCGVLLFAETYNCSNQQLYIQYRTKINQILF
jgi:hypothetical protein